MQVKITNKEAVLKTKGTFCDEDINVVVDESLLIELMEKMIDGTLSGNLTTYVSYIRENGLSCLPNLTSIYAPNVTTSGSYAFSKDTNLEDVYLPLLTNVGWGGFDGCKAIKELRLPCLLRTTNYSFQNCTALTDIYSGYNGYITLGNSNSFNGCNQIKLHVRPEYAEGYATQPNWSYLIETDAIQIVGDYTD